MQGLYQARGGAILRGNIGRGTRLIGGYYFSEEEESTEDWEAWSRYFGGFDHTLFEWRGDWKAQHVAEFFDVPGAGNYYRVRHRSGWNARSRVAPYANVEVLWDHDGWRSTRFQAGTAWQLTTRATVDAHYFYEPRRLDVGAAPRHMWGTTLQYRIGRLR